MRELLRYDDETADPNRAPVDGAQCPLCGELERHRIDCPANLERVPDPHPDYDRDPDPLEARAILSRLVARVQAWRAERAGRPGFRPSDYL